jgi:hypothetical protein
MAKAWDTNLNFPWPRPFASKMRAILYFVVTLFVWKDMDVNEHHYIQIKNQVKEQRFYWLSKMDIYIIF